jgi:hypothetical protein
MSAKDLMVTVVYVFLFMTVWIRWRQESEEDGDRFHRDDDQKVIPQIQNEIYL